MAKKKPKPQAKGSKASPNKKKPVLSKAGRAYANKKLYNQVLSKAKSLAIQDIGQIPPVVDPARKAKAHDDLEFFAQTYFPSLIKKKFSENHRRFISHLQHCVIHGGQKAQAMPRKSGKSTLCEIAAMWAMLTGRRKHIIFIGRTFKLSFDSLRTVKNNLLRNDLLLEDYPEVCFPVRALDENAAKAKGQRVGDDRTYIEWKRDTVVLPQVKGSLASGAKFYCVGFDQASRGSKHELNGEAVRPDMVIVDDPQTNKSARNQKIISEQLSTITGSILGLSGGDIPIACFVPCTIIEENDLAMQLLDRSVHPHFLGEVCKMVYEWPKNQELWDEYEQIQRDALNDNDLSKPETRFYAANREAMDEGAVVGWEEDYYYGVELSAIQHAYNLRFTDPDTFAAEYQNEPRSKSSSGMPVVKSPVLAAKVNGLDRFVVPAGSAFLTAFIDVQQDVLFYVVCAWKPDFTGSVIDYGAYPDQRLGYFSLGDLRHTLRSKYVGAGIEGAITSGLRDLTNLLMSQHYRLEEAPDNTTMTLGKILIDSGNWASTIYQFCRTAQQRAIIMPSKGEGITASACKISNYKRGIVIGNEWYIHRPPNQPNAILSIDTNFWKSQVHTSLYLAHGDRGSISLYGKHNENHKMFADHCTSEYNVETFGRGRTVYEWKQADRSKDNHWLDCLVGCAVAADWLGCRTNPALLRPAKSTAQAKPRIVESTLLEC